MESKEIYVVPSKEDFVKQANAISRAAYTMPVMARRLIYFAMAQVRPEDKEFMDVVMQVGDVVRALGLTDGAENYAVIRDAGRTCAKWIIEIEQPDGGWEMFGWLSYAKLDAETDAITLRLNDVLRPYILNLQEAYSILRIADIAKIQSRHALRWYELIMSRRGQADKNGRWWVEYSIAEIRHLLKIGPNEYARTSSLRNKVIDYPLTEINEANVGIVVTPEYIRRRRNLWGVRVQVQIIHDGDPKPVAPLTKEQEAEDRFIELHRDRYTQILEQLKTQQDLPGMSWASAGMRELALRAEAMKILKEELSKEAGKRGRGRPRKNGN
jgi:hypothetical protein